MPRILYQPLLNHPLLNTFPTSRRARLRRPSRILGLKAIQKLSPGRPEVQNSKEAAGVWQPGSVVLACSKKPFLCKEQRGAFVE